MQEAAVQDLIVLVEAEEQAVAVQELDIKAQLEQHKMQP
jgi:hypothetical protein